MNNCAVICEYNPFHTGHKYQLDRIRAHGADNIVCIMSGAFVQSAMPAFCDKALRAECAVLGGADAVIELPTVFSTASAQIFAQGAVKLIVGIKDIKTLAMGACAEPSDILRIADAKIRHADRFNALLKNALSSGKSYNASTVCALNELCSALHPDISVEKTLADPNNILCIEYISAIYNCAADIEPLIIMRKGAAYNDLRQNDEHISATAVRHAADIGEFDTVKLYIPYKADDIYAWRQEHAPDISLFKSLAVYAVKCASAEDIAKLRHCSEGMEFLIKKLSRFFDYDRYIAEAVGKRYGKKRIARLMLDALLGIERSDIDNKFCTRLLACKNNFDFSLLPHCVKTDNASLKKAAAEDAQIKRSLDIEERATALYNTVCRLDGDYYNYSLIKV
ncbi:MAG: nucleotidyltransferase family protein [Roseburia sp.]|nr:nucleotidyltransferase family protein [Roseburia sp.]